MTEPTFRVVFSGNTLPGTDRDTAISNLAQLLKRTPEQVAPAFSGKPSVMKKGIVQADAEKYCRVLEKAGLLVRAEPEVPAAGKPAGGAALSLAPEGAAPVSIAAPEKPAVAAPKISSSLALVDDEEHQEETAASGKAAPPMTCPSCGHVQAKADVCESCHVVIAKFLQRQAEREKERQAAALTGSTDDNTEVEEAVAGDSAGKSSFFGKLFGKFKRG